MKGDRHNREGDEHETNVNGEDSYDNAPGKIQVVQQAIGQIDLNNPRVIRLRRALLASAIAAVEKFLDHPLGAALVAFRDNWIQNNDEESYNEKSSTLSDRQLPDNRDTRTDRVVDVDWVDINDLDGDDSNLQKTWLVLIQDTLSRINIQAVTDALQPDLPAGEPIRICPLVAELPWVQAAKEQEQAINSAIISSCDRSVPPRFAIFSLAQIPLAIHLGFILSDRVEVCCFQFDREVRSWRWPDTAEVDCNIKMSGLPEGVIEDPVEVVIRVSLSAKIAKGDTDEVVPHRTGEIDIFVDNPNVMWLRSPLQLNKLGRVFQQVLTTIRDRIPDCERIHLFYAGPTGGAIVIGQQINPRMNPAVEVYEYSRKSSPRYQWALNLD